MNARGNRRLCLRPELSAFVAAKMQIEKSLPKKKNHNAVPCVKARISFGKIRAVLVKQGGN